MRDNVAGAQAVEIREVLGRGAIRAYQVLWLVFALFVAMGLVGSALLVVAYVAAPAGDPNRRLVLGIGLVAVASVFFIAVVAAVALIVLTKTRTRTRTVISLLPASRCDFVLCEEGVYAVSLVNRFAGRRYHLLYPWASLAICAMDEKRGRIGLRGSGETAASGCGRHLLKLEAKGYFPQMQGIVLAHLGEGQRASRSGLAGAGWAIVRLAFVALLCCGVVAADVVASRYFLNVLSKGPVGDGRCDICNNALPVIGTELVVTDGKPTGIVSKVGGLFIVENGRTVHEYCQVHAIDFALIHPTRVPEAVQQVLAVQGLKQSDKYNMAVGMALSLGVWLSIAFVLIVLLVWALLSPWQRAQTLRR